MAVRVPALVRRGWPILAAIILLVVPYLGLANFTYRVLSEILIIGLAAASLTLLVGHGGLTSLGHGVFFGIGGYAAGVFAVRSGAGNYLIALVFAVLISALVAAALGTFVLRPTGLYFMILTVGVCQLFFILADKWHSVTGGTDGLTGIPRFFLGTPGWPLNAAAAVFQVVVVITIVGVAALVLFAGSRQGLMLNGTRLNELRMSAIGYSAPFIRYRAYILSAAVCGAAGSLFPVLNGFIGPEQIGFGLSAELLIIVILGGSVSFYGAFAGAAIIVLAQSYLSIYTNYWLGIIGAILFVIALVAPEGIATVPAIRRMLTRTPVEAETEGRTS